MPPTPPPLAPLEIGGGTVETVGGDGYRLHLPPVERRYADSQLDDHRSLRRGEFPWRPPFRMSVRARASHSQPQGTLGFGLWNDPFTFSLGQGGAGRKLPAAPQAVWFFYASPPTDLALAPEAPGYGWKASCLDTPQLPALILNPLAAGGVLASRVPGLQTIVISRALAAVRASEVALSVDLHEWHTYTLDWGTERASFAVDGTRVLEAESPPQGPLGFVAWIDNQYAVASPEKGFRFGLVKVLEEQWLEIEALRLEGS